MGREVNPTAQNEKHFAQISTNVEGRHDLGRVVLPIVAVDGLELIIGIVPVIVAEAAAQKGTTTIVREVV